MKTELKKEIFLSILDTIFNDISIEIDKDNCISFYHFLIDTLINDIKEFSENQSDDIFLYDSIIDLLCNFDLMGNSIEDWSPDFTLNFLKNFSCLNDVEFKNSIYKIRLIYIIIKNDFIFGLT